MIHRLIIGFGLAAAMVGPSFAADLGPYYPAPPPPLVDIAPECVGPGRPLVQVWQPPQTAYIPAGRCPATPVLFDFLGEREKLFVYYNGGSMYKTDINVLVVPKH